MILWLAAFFSFFALAASTDTVMSPFSILGRCPTNFNFTQDPRFDFDTYIKEHKGYWTFSRVPDTPDNANLRWALLRNRADIGDVYISEIFVQEYNKDIVKAVVETVEMDSDKVIIIKPIGSSILIKLMFLLFEPEKIGLYYACSEDSDYEYDSLFLITTGCEPSPADEQKINEIIDRYNFKVSMKDLPQ